MADSQNSGSVEMTATEVLLRQRGAAYGDVAKQALVWENLMKEVATQAGYQAMDAQQRQSIRVILLKVSRLACGDPGRQDTWDDIAGYAMLANRVHTVSPAPGSWVERRTEP